MRKPVVRMKRRTRVCETNLRRVEEISESVWRGLAGFPGREGGGKEWSVTHLELLALRPSHHDSSGV